jgi:hypothetical protein
VEVEEQQLQEIHLFFQQLQVQVEEKELLVKPLEDLVVVELFQVELQVEQEILLQLVHLKVMQEDQVIITSAVEEEVQQQLEKLEEDLM